MSDNQLSSEQLALLASFDTPTICNAIEVVHGKRGFDNFTHQTMHWSDRAVKAVVGYARTAKIASVAPSSEPEAIVRAVRQDYFRHMATGARPGIAVVEDVDGDAAIGAWWGEVHAYVHKNVCGLSGAVTNGLMRDLADLAPDFPVLAGGIGPSHGFVHVQEFGTDVTICDMRVADGDLIHADVHGAVVIENEVLTDLSKAIATLQRNENIVLGPVKRGGVDLEQFETLWSDFEKART
ncbi:MAG: RraA family protein [Pseudomonadota bacterium]